MLFRRRKRISWKTRATIGGLGVAIAALYALAVSYDIAPGRLLNYLFGSVVLVLLAMLAALVLVVASKLVAKAIRALIHRLLP